VLEFGGAVSGQIVNGAFSGETVLFANGQGTLILDHSLQFHGLIEASAQGTTLSPGDLIDLRDLSFVVGHMSATVAYNSTTQISSISFGNGTATIPNILFWGITATGIGPSQVTDTGYRGFRSAGFRNDDPLIAV